LLTQNIILTWYAYTTVYKRDSWQNACATAAITFIQMRLLIISISIFRIWIKRPIYMQYVRCWTRMWAQALNTVKLYWL